MNRLQTAKRLFVTVWKYSKKELCLNIISAIVSGIGGAINIVFLGIFYDILENSSGLTQGKAFWYCIVSIIAALFLSLILSAFDDFYNNEIKPILRLSSTERMEINLFRKVKTVELKAFDDNKFYDKVSWVKENYVSKTFSVLDSIMSIVSFAITILASSIVLTYISPIVGVILIIACFIGAFVNYRKGKKDELFDEEMLLTNRKEGYIENIFTNKACAKELRCSKIITLVIDKYDKILKEKYDKEKKHRSKMMWYNIIGDLFQYLTKPLIYLYLFYHIIVTKTIGIGSLAVTFAAMLRFNHIFEQSFGIIVSLLNDIEYCKGVFEFFEKENETVDGVIPFHSFESYNINQLSFSYKPGIKVINNIDLCINKGEKIAIVGSNGAGKTTLINLILRLYQPDTGKILLNNKPLNDYSYQNFPKKVVAVFQDYSLYAVSIYENVLMDCFDNDLKGKAERAIEETMLKSKIDSLPYGMNTILSKEFENGVELSGGERQKVALSRIFARDYDLVIMDEPSSALDAKAEYEFNHKILSKMEDKTVILVSHRLSSTKFVDRIIVVENGEIIESGSHNELMEKKGRYFDLFQLQSKYYSLST